MDNLMRDISDQINGEVERRLAEYIKQLHGENIHSIITRLKEDRRNMFDYIESLKRENNTLRVALAHLNESRFAMQRTLEILKPIPLDLHHANNPTFSPNIFD